MPVVLGTICWLLGAVLLVNLLLLLAWDPHGQAVETRYGCLR